MLGLMPCTKRRWKARTRRKRGDSRDIEALEYAGLPMVKDEGSPRFIWKEKPPP